MISPFKNNIRRAMIADHAVTKFYGNNTEISDIKTMPDGYSPDSINWITGTEQDCIILRRGTALLGKTRQGTGKITGLGVGTRIDGTQVPFFSYGRKINYYDASLDDNVEIGTDLLPAAANGDEVSIFTYQNLGGAFVYCSSINSSVYKIPVANPANSVDQLATDFKGFLKFGQSRSILYNRKGSTAAKGYVDRINLYMSWVDGISLASLPFANIPAEAIGSSGSKTYTGTLAKITGKLTAAQVSFIATVAAGTETFIDDKNGNLLSNYVGTGTINYATGAYNITFSDTTTASVTANYYTEDATNHGVLDFSFAGTRVAGTGRFLPQFDGGGNLNAVFPLANVFYSFHTLKTWQTTIPTDDDDQGTTPASNLPFREKMGVSYPYSAFGGATGIYYINNSNPNRPEVYQLQLFTGATAANIASPVLISKALNLSAHKFDCAVVFEWGIYICLCFQQVRNGVADEFNSRMFIYNKKSGSWDLMDYPATRLAEYNGTLIAGDPLTNNVYTLFSGFDDDGSSIPNYWTSGFTNHGITGQKVTNRIVVDGIIQAAQNIDVSIALDGGNFVKVFTIQGNGSYVDTGKSIAVGSFVEGSKIIGGGAIVYANPFNVEFTINSSKYQYIRVKFEATGGGYAQINYYTFKDNRYKGSRTLPEKTIN